MAPSIDVEKLFSLAGKTAIVTGATGGLGLAMTTALASAGADIVAIESPNDPWSAALKASIEGCGRKFERYECDLRDGPVIRAVFENIWFDGIAADILLNCVGIPRRASSIDFTNEDIDIVLDVNVKATILSCQEFAKPLLKTGRPGKIINVASIVSSTDGKHITPYAASAGAVVQATKAFSNEWVEDGIQCNCICPNYFRTHNTERRPTDSMYETGNGIGTFKTTLRRWGDPEQLSGAVIFLASAASDYVIGTTVTCDGGFIGL